MQSFNLLTDLYQFTMAYGYWRWQLHERDAVFHLFYRTNPCHGNYAVSCGLATITDFLQHYRFSEADIAFLRTLQTQDKQQLFPEEFLAYLRQLKFSCDLWAIPEGTVVGAYEPLLRISGPLLQCQLLESTLLNIVNFQTLIATKAARICYAAAGDEVIELGMRSAHGVDGALSASRAAYIGGCTATSNVMASKKFAIPLRGTHSHSWVTVFADELTAFTNYAAVLPENVILLVDTYAALNGIKHAITVGQQLRAAQRNLYAIRLDSGDLLALSKAARSLLDEAGFWETKIIATSALDEVKIAQLKAKGAPINIWGVGSNLVTAATNRALDGVYKLAALRDDNGSWCYKMKISADVIKTSIPGIHQVRRFYNHKVQPVADLIYDIQLGLACGLRGKTLTVPYRQFTVGDYASAVDLLVPIFNKGRLLSTANESIHDIRLRCRHNVANFAQHYAAKPYIVGLAMNLHQQQQAVRKSLKRSM
jgi:nicotinate phosphoribosyltransferase